MSSPTDKKLTYGNHGLLGPPCRAACWADSRLNTVLFGRQTEAEYPMSSMDACHQSLGRTTWRVPIPGLLWESDSYHTMLLHAAQGGSDGCCLKIQIYRCMYFWYCGGLWYTITTFVLSVLFHFVVKFTIWLTRVFRLVVDAFLFKHNIAQQS